MLFSCILPLKSVRIWLVGRDPRFTKTCPQDMPQFFTLRAENLQSWGLGTLFCSNVSHGMPWIAREWLGPWMFQRRSVPMDEQTRKCK
jgi:hypothetical protein